MSSSMFADDSYKAISTLSTEYDFSGGFEYTATIKANRSLLKYIVFSILTCGIYSFYFFNLCGRDINLIAMKDGRKTANFYLVCLLSVVLFVLLGAFPLYYHISNGGEITFVSSLSAVKVVHCVVIFFLLLTTLAPILVWFHNFSERVDNELQKRKTGMRLPPILFWIFALSLPLFFYTCNIIVFGIRDSIPFVWLTISLYVFFIVLSVISVLIYFGAVILAMNILAQCAIYKNVEFR